MVLGLFSRKKRPVDELPVLNEGDIVAYPPNGPRPYYGHVLPTLEYANGDDYYGMDGYGVHFVFVAMNGRKQRMMCNSLRKVTDVAQEIANVRQEALDDIRSTREYLKDTVDLLQRYLRSC